MPLIYAAFDTGVYKNYCIGKLQGCDIRKCFSSNILSCQNLVSSLFHGKFSLQDLKIIILDLKTTIVKIGIKKVSMCWK